MIRLRFALIAMPMLALAACASPAPPQHTGGPLPPTPAPAPTAMACQAKPAQWALGKLASAEVIERVRQDSHSRVTRVIRPGEMITMDYSTERVDIRVDGGNVIVEVSCG